MKTLFFISAALMIATLTACSNNNTAAEPGFTTEELQTSTGSEAAAFTDTSTSTLPSFNIQYEGGKQVNLLSFKGKKVFVNLWASWCPPCRREMPSIEKLAQSVDTSKVAFIMLSLDDTFDKALKFAESQKLQLPIFYPAENLPLLFNVQGIPTTFIFNENGELTHRIDGGDNYNSEHYRNMLQ
jgi:thiol-disulfide isomerase/thioredoxin